MILVTGGTGLVGSHLLYLLLNTHESLRAIKRVSSDLSATKSVFKSYNAIALFDKIEWITADILDVPSLAEAFADITNVYHCAAHISFSNSDYQQLLKINVEGTANVVNLCIAKGVKKLCHVSTVAALGTSLDGSPIIEDTHWNPEAENMGYAISKFGAEMEVWRGSQEGLAVVIVQPSVIIGEGHWQGASGSIFSMVKNGIPKYPKGATGFVDVKDVVKAMYLLMKSEVTNESFLLSGTNLTYQEIISEISKAIGAKPTKKAVKNWQLWIVALLQKMMYVFTGKKPSLNKESIGSLQNISTYDGSKITKVIPFQYTTIAQTIKRVAVAFTAK